MANMKKWINYVNDRRAKFGARSPLNFGIIRQNLYLCRIESGLPIGRAWHCPTMLWHLILISHISIPLFCFLPSVSHNMCRLTIECRLIISSRELAAHAASKKLYRELCKRIQDGVNLHGECSFWGMLPPLFLWTVSSLYQWERQNSPIPWCIIMRVCEIFDYRQILMVWLTCTREFRGRGRWLL